LPKPVGSLSVENVTVAAPNATTAILTNVNFRLVAGDVLGVIGPNAKAMWNALLAPDNGLLALMPWVLLAIVGFVAIRRDPEARKRVGAEAIVCATVVISYVLFLGSLVPEFGRAGWSVGPRYIAVAMPFAGWLAAAGFSAVDGRPVLRTVAHGLVLASVVIFVVATTTFPHWSPSVGNPLWDVSFRILGDDLAPRSLGTAMGLRGVVSLMPLYVICGALVVWLLADRVKGRWLTTAAAAAVAIVIVVAYRAVPSHSPYVTIHYEQTIRRVWEP